MRENGACGNALVAGIEAQHYLAQADQVPHALAFALNFQFCHCVGDGRPTESYTDIFRVNISALVNTPLKPGKPFDFNNMDCGAGRRREDRRFRLKNKRAEL